MAIRAMVVDDSAFMRKLISDMLSDITGVEVVGVGRNGKDAIERIDNLKPDIITLDVEMPIMNGIETLKIIRNNYDIPVIMLSSNTNAEITIEALELGALDFIEKPVDMKDNLHEIQKDLEKKIRALFSDKMGLHKQAANPNPVDSSPAINKKIDAVVIGASTGGPKVLVNIISRLPQNIRVPIFVVQHMPEGFTKSLAERMDRESKIKVVEASHGMTIKANTVYLAPGGYHMVVSSKQIMLNTEDKIHGVRPAVDKLFLTAAEVYNSKLLGVMLTGMGKDGSHGMQKIKALGGINIVQNEESCITFGMPGSAVAKGVVDRILTIGEISETINRLAR